MTYKIIIEPVALKALEAISDRRVRQNILDRIDGLTHDPDKQGKPLTGELTGYRSLRAAGQRYRIVYKVDRGIVTVYVVAVGIRKEGARGDVYRLAQKLVKLGLA